MIFLGDYKTKYQLHEFSSTKHPKYTFARDTTEQKADDITSEWYKKINQPPSDTEQVPKVLMSEESPLLTGVECAQLPDKNKTMTGEGYCQYLKYDNCDTWKYDNTLSLLQ